MHLKYLFACLLLLVLWLFPAYYYQSINHNYMNGDDYTILKIAENFEDGASYSKVLVSEIKQDFKIGRLKPVNILFFTTQIYFLRDNYLAWNIYVLFLGFVTSIIMLYGLINLGFDLWPALLGTIIIFFGHQILIWYENTAGEMHAVFFLAVSLLFAQRITGVEGKFSGKKLVLFLTSVVLFSLSKETFILLIPASIFLIFKANIPNSKIKAGSCLFLFTVLIVELFICYKMNKEFKGGAYSGFRLEELSILNFIQKVYLILKNEPVFWISLFGLFMITDRHIRTNQFTPEMIRTSIIFLPFIIITTQLIAFHQNGFLPRFILPISIGFGFMASIISDIIWHDAFYSKFARVCFVCVTLYASYLNYRHGLCRIEVSLAQKESFTAIFKEINTINSENEPVYFYGEDIRNDKYQIVHCAKRYWNIKVLNLNSKEELADLNPKNILVFEAQLNAVYGVLNKTVSDFRIEKTYFPYLVFLRRK